MRHRSPLVFIGELVKCCCGGRKKGFKKHNLGGDWNVSFNGD